jgi:hypothetical protein
MYLLIIGGIILVLIFAFLFHLHKDSNSPKKTFAKGIIRSPSNNQDLSSVLANVSIQISSYVGYDPTGGQKPYNSDQFVQYVNNALQLLQQAQSSGSLNNEFGQYLGKLLNQVKLVTPLEKSSFDAQGMGTIAGQLYMGSMALINGISWQGASSDIMQDAVHAVDTYQAWLAGSMSSADAGKYMNDPIVYNLKIDTGGDYPSSVIASLPLSFAETDAWYLSNGNANTARIWYDLGQFIGFGCIYTADGNTC